MGYSACMTTICVFSGDRGDREVKGVKPNVLSPQVQLDFAARLCRLPKQESSWSEYKDLQSDYRIPIFNIYKQEILTKVVYLFNRIANSYTPCSRIANPAEPRRVSENSMGVLKITP